MPPPWSGRPARPPGSMMPGSSPARDPGRVRRGRGRAEASAAGHTGAHRDHRGPRPGWPQPGRDRRRGGPRRPHRGGRGGTPGAPPTPPGAPEPAPPAPPIAAAHEPDDTATELDRRIEGALAAYRALGEQAGKAPAGTIIRGRETAAPWLLAMGVGDLAAFDRIAALRFGAAIERRLGGRGVRRLAVWLPAPLAGGGGPARGVPGGARGRGGGG